MGYLGGVGLGALVAGRFGGGVEVGAGPLVASGLCAFLVIPTLSLAVLRQLLARTDDDDGDVALADKLLSRKLPSPIPATGRDVVPNNLPHLLKRERCRPQRRNAILLLPFVEGFRDRLRLCEGGAFAVQSDDEHLIAIVPLAIEAEDGDTDIAVLAGDIEDVRVRAAIIGESQSPHRELPGRLVAEHVPNALHHLHDNPVPRGDGLGGLVAGRFRGGLGDATLGFRPVAEVLGLGVAAAATGAAARVTEVLGLSSGAVDRGQVLPVALRQLLQRREQDAPLHPRLPMFVQPLRRIDPGEECLVRPVGDFQLCPLDTVTQAHAGIPECGQVEIVALPHFQHLDEVLDRAFQSVGVVALRLVGGGDLVGGTRVGARQFRKVGGGGLDAQGVGGFGRRHWYAPCGEAHLQIKAACLQC